MMLPSSRAAVLSGLAWCGGRPWTSLVYLPVVVIAAITALPIVLFVVAAGFTWDLYLAVLITYVGGVLGSCCAYYVGRKCLKGPLQRMLMRSDTMRGIQALLCARSSGWRWVLLVRVPYMPLAHVSYLLAVSDVPPDTFLATTAVGIIPGTVLYCVLGTGIHNIQDFVNGKESGGSTVAMGIGVTLTLILFIVLVCVSKKRMNEAVDAHRNSFSEDFSAQRDTSQSASLARHTSPEPAEHNMEFASE